jgi:hypothetical protein
MFSPEVRYPPYVRPRFVVLLVTNGVEPQFGRKASHVDVLDLPMAMKP